MGRIKGKRPSPAMVVAITALVFAVAGSAVAGIATVSVLSKKEKKQTRNIAKDEINKAAPGLSVANATNAGQLGGTGASGYMRFGGTIPSGATVRGAFTSADRDDISAFARGGESFPLPAPADLTNSQVNFSPSSVASDDDPACSGSFDVPTAPPGKVCLYHIGGGNYQDATASGVSIGGGGLQSRYGFGIEGPAFPGSPGQAYIRGTWAYTAP